MKLQDLNSLSFEYEWIQFFFQQYFFHRLIPLFQSFFLKSFYIFLIYGFSIVLNSRWYYEKILWSLFRGWNNWCFLSSTTRIKNIWEQLILGNNFTFLPFWWWGESSLIWWQFYRQFNFFGGLKRRNRLREILNLIVLFIIWHSLNFYFWIWPSK